MLQIGRREVEARLRQHRGAARQLFRMPPLLLVESQLLLLQEPPLHVDRVTHCLHVGDGRRGMCVLALA